MGHKPYRPVQYRFWRLMPTKGGSRKGAALFLFDGHNGDKRTERRERRARFAGARPCRPLVASWNESPAVSAVSAVSAVIVVFEAALRFVPSLPFLT